MKKKSTFVVSVGLFYLFIIKENLSLNLECQAYTITISKMNKWMLLN